ncbi:hypothetical protein E2C01_067107 [Portunus trituberculatus]|uniref:Uncharacterized protein n=1 Tax=Portunus trituberculatus TaxID=210409 RepID=A0A5B7HWL0_PORTR|nr:hypothetical protein [Portunus trituberculatus]
MRGVGAAARGGGTGAEEHQCHGSDVRWGVRCCGCCYSSPLLCV